NESYEELARACAAWPTAHVLHGSGVTVAGVSFYGIGGGIPVTPFGSWSYDFTEEQETELLAGCPVGGVLISHSPPNGTLDVSARGQTLGSVAVREAVLRQRPALVVCGHIHACAGQQAAIGPTSVINAGPQGVEWELPSGRPFRSPPVATQAHQFQRVGLPPLLNLSSRRPRRSSTGAGRTRRRSCQ